MFCGFNNLPKFPNMKIRSSRASENPHGNWKIKIVNREPIIQFGIKFNYIEQGEGSYKMHYIHRPCSQLNIDESIEAKRFNQTEAIRD